MLRDFKHNPRASFLQCLYQQGCHSRAASGCILPVLLALGSTAPLLLLYYRYIQNEA